MSKKKLFDDDSEDEVTLKTENEYAKKYDAWREKEEIHKLEQKYGSKALDPNASLSSDSEDESDEPPEVSEETETQFLKTLALLKTKDPRIYDPNFKCFDDMEEKPKDKKLENDGKPKTLTFADSSDDDDDDPNIFTIEKKAEIDPEPIKKSKSSEKPAKCMKTLTFADSSDDDDDDPNIFTIEKKAEIDPEPIKKSKSSEKPAKEDKLKDFLTGKAEHIEDDVEKDLEPLKAFWSDPKLNEGEAFLRDYILNKKYLEEGDVGEAEDKLRDDAELEADEELVEEQGKFERAYNFRFEEPDDEYLKRYPRTMNFIRPKDDKRSRKRAETRTRKEEEKKKKMEEIARLKALKLKEIQEKIARIKQVTGNQELAFKDEDIEGDFDPEEHDRRMKAIFDETYYGEADDEKPVFPDLDEELEIENWEKYEEEEYKEKNSQDDGEAPHCEDDDFNMDADYDPKTARENLLEELKRNMGKKRRNRKRKTKLGQLLATEKPKFIPDEDKTYSEFMEEYYRMDCEDVIGGDLPTRFKYREVLPNDYGLSVEEILLADDKELTQWVPLKKLVRLRAPHVEKSELHSYQQRAADVALKRKLLPSLFKDLPQEPEVVVPVEGNKKKRKKKKKDKEQAEATETVEETEKPTVNGDEEDARNEEPPAKKKKNRKKRKESGGSVAANDDVQADVPKSNKKDEQLNNSITDMKNDDKIPEVNVNQSKKIRKDSGSLVESSEDNVTDKAQSNKKKKKRTDSFIVETVGVVEPSQTSTDTTGENVKNSGKRTHSESNINVTQNNGVSKKKKNKNKNNKKDTQNQNTNKNKKDKMKFKAKNKFKTKAQDKPTHPFSNLSDERLKAYGLNPKKYKNFLKYKKF